MIGPASLAIAALTCANYGYQALGSQLWSVALERSYFQVVAIIAYSAFIHFWRKAHR
jgi:hypothetical protein